MKNETRQCRNKNTSAQQEFETYQRKMLCVGAGLIVIGVILTCILVWLWYAGSQADWLVVVADTRRVSSVILLYFVNLYNTNRALLAVWIVAFTLACGGFAGLGMDVSGPDPQQEFKPQPPLDS